MCTLPDWFLTEHTASEPEELPEYHANQWRKMPYELRSYVMDALEKGCALTYTLPYANSLNIVKPATGPDDEELVFLQLVMNDPRDETFMFYDADGNHPNQANRTSQCKGIPIWDTEYLVEAAFVCDGCGKKAGSLSELEFYPFAGLGCPECAKAGIEYFNKNQLWR